MTIDDISKGKGNNFILLCKDEGKEYKIHSTASTGLELLKELYILYRRVAEKSGDLGKFKETFN